MEETQVIKDTASELLNKLQIAGKIEVVKTEENYKLTIEAEESGLLIGFHGNTLNSFQLILGTLVFKKLNKWLRIEVNVGDYREKREEALKNLAQQYAQEAILNKETVILPPLTPAERRIVHLILQDNAEVVSESQGEGRDRRLTIKPKNI